MSDAPAPNHTPSGRPPPAPIARRWLLNLALLAVVVALGLFLWYRPAGESEPEAPPLTPLAPDAVQRIEIERPEQPPVRLVRAEGAWRLTAPVAARVDTFAVDSLLTLTEAPADRPVKTGGGDLAPFGLDRPAVTVRLDDAEVRFGTAHPIENERYILYESGVYLVPARFYDYASVSYTDFIDTRLLAPGRELVALELPGFTLTLEDGTWRREPEIEALSSDRINAFVNDWRHARALNVQKYAGDPVQERLTLTVAAPDGEPSALTIGILARSPELVLYRPDEGLQYHFPEAMGERLLSISEK